MDIEPVTYNLDPGDLAQTVTPRAGAIVAVDLFGHLVHLQPYIQERLGDVNS